jgi:DNA-binding NarL/FixJ family response regulator
VGVLDIGMPGMSGIDVTREVRAARLKTELVLLSVHREGSFVRSGLEAGACAYVVKNAASRELVEAVRSAASHERYVSPSVAGELVAPASPHRQKALTPRERDVLRMLAQGLPSKLIASRLGISVRTVEGHRAAVMDKLGLRSVPELVKYAIAHHLTTLEE